MLLLFLLLTQEAEREKAIQTPEATPDEIRRARETLGIDHFKAACLAGYKKAQNWQMAETGKSAMDDARWVLFLLRAGIHPLMQLIDRATGEEPVFVYRSRAEQASFQKHQPSGDQIFEMRSKLNKTQSEMCQLAHVRFISTWGAYESGFTKMSPERWELLELQLGVHQQCEIKFRDNVSSIPSSALKGPSNDQARIDQYHLPSAKQFGIKQREDKRP